eukprot:11565393-Alexandrium_andersonii.AAC.1
MCRELWIRAALCVTPEALRAESGGSALLAELEHCAPNPEFNTSSTGVLHRGLCIVPRSLGAAD